MRVISTRIIILIVFCEIHASIEYEEYQSGNTQVYDCRFWREPKQDIATIIMNNKIDKQGSVFYFWDAATLECKSCRVCPEKTLSECTYVKDTQCMTQMDWMLKMGLKQNKNYFLDQFENKLRSERKEDEGVIVYKAHTSVTKQPDVFGKPVYTDESVEEKDSPTRTIQRKYGSSKNFGKKIDVDTDQSFGKPTFYAKDSGKNSNQRSNERPILTILREVLKNNQSRNISVKDVVSVSKEQGNERIKGTMDTNLVEERHPDRSGQPANQYQGYQFEYPGHEHMLETTKRPPTTMSTTSTTIRTTTEVSTTAELSTSYHSINIYDPDYTYHDERKDIWPYRTDDKYSLFYYHPPKYDDQSNKDEEYYPHPHEDDQVYDYQYESRAAKDNENLNAPYIGHAHEPNKPLGTFSPMVPTVEDTTTLKLDTVVLEKIFVGVACLVVLLLAVLVLVLTKNRYRQASFKLLDNADGVSSYHSVSPPNITPRTSSPLSPGDVSGDFISHCSTTRDLVSLSRSPTGKDDNQKIRYDRTKLSIPLQPSSTSPVFTSDSSRSTSDHVQPLKSPLTLLPLHSYKAPAERCKPNGGTVIPPAVARSLRNINPASSYSSKIDRDLENKLFN